MRSNNIVLPALAGLVAAAWFSLAGPGAYAMTAEAQADVCSTQIGSAAEQIMRARQMGNDRRALDKLIDASYASARDKTMAAVYHGMVTQAWQVDRADTARGRSDIATAFGQDYEAYCNGTQP